jgi:hypothetical protein
MKEMNRMEKVFAKNFSLITEAEKKGCSSVFT